MPAQMELIGQAKALANDLKWSEAADVLASALADDPENIVLLDKRGWYLSRAKRYAEAIAVYEFLASRRPGQAKWPYMVGYQYYDQQRWKQAIAWFDRALALRDQYIVVLYRKGYAHSCLNETGLAVRAFSKVRDVWETLSDGRRQIEAKHYSDACFQLGKILMARGQTQKAEMAFAEAVRLGPPDPYKHYNYGKALLKNGHPEKALEQLEKSDRLDPGKDYVQVYKARACMALHDFRRAENYLGRIPSHRRKGYVWYSIGELRLAKGDPTAAVDALRRATALDSNSHNSHFLLGMASEQCGSLAEASAAYSAAVKLRMQRYHLHFPEAEKRLAAVQAMVSSNEAATPAPNPPSEPEGHIKSFKEKRGYGFIAVQEGADLFFHVSEVTNPEAIIVGAPVTFEVVDTHKGPRATNVSVV